MEEGLGDRWVKNTVTLARRLGKYCGVTSQARTILFKPFSKVGVPSATNRRCRRIIPPCRTGKSLHRTACATRVQPEWEPALPYSASIMILKDPQVPAASPHVDTTRFRQWFHPIILAFETSGVTKIAQSEHSRGWRLLKGHWRTW